MGLVGFVVRWGLDLEVHHGEKLVQSRSSALLEGR